MMCAFAGYSIQRMNTKPAKGRLETQSYNRTFQCPYFGSNKKPTRITCEGGTGINFPDKKSAERYIRRHCTRIHGWKDCSIAEMLDEYYERTLRR